MLGKFGEAWRRARLRYDLERDGFTVEDAKRVAEAVYSHDWDKVPYIIDMETRTVTWEKPE